MLQDRYGRLGIVAALIVIAVILIMAPGMQSKKQTEEQLNFTSMPKENVSKEKTPETTVNTPQPVSVNEKLVSPEDQMLDAWGMGKREDKALQEPLPQEELKQESNDLPAEPVHIDAKPEPKAEHIKTVTDALRTPAGPAKAIIKPAVPNAKQIKVNGKCFAPPLIAAPMVKSECNKVNNSYGINACPKADDGLDGWAGAVKVCGGVDKMPDMDDLLAIAAELYSRSTIKIEESARSNYKAYGKFSPNAIDCDKFEMRGFSYDAAIAKEYGYPEQAGFSVWGKTEINPKYGLGLTYNSSSVQYSACTDRSAQTYYSVCQVDCQ